MSSVMSVFEGCQIVLDLTTSVRFKEKTQLRKAITSVGGVVSFIVTKKSTHVVCNDPEKAEISYKCKMALKYGIPVVSMDFIWQCVNTTQLQNTDNFLVIGKTKSEVLKEGKISATKYQKKDKKKEVKPYVNVGAIKVWSVEDKNCPEFTSDAQLAKFATFNGQKKVKNKQEKTFAVLEIHIDEKFSTCNSAYKHKYRVVSHSGLLHNVETGDRGTVEYRFCTTVDEALTVYSHLYREQQQQGMTVAHDLFSRHIGSSVFKQVMGELGLESVTLTPGLENLVEHVWVEAQGQLESVLSVPVTSLKMEQVGKAEAVLKQIKAALDECDNAKMPKLMQEFYSAIPHQNTDTNPSKAWLSRKQDICQLVKDMISVSEATDWSTRSSLQSKYRALRCVIEHLHRTSPEHLHIKQLVLSSMTGPKDIEIRNVFAVNRPVESVNFTQNILPSKLLFHASKADNMVGILSRGLLMPRVVVDDHGGTRTDPGKLGAGIYFASAASTSVGYSWPSSTAGSRFMLVNEVALGNTKVMYKMDESLTSAPEGHHSVLGAKSTEERTSDFKDDEYVIYDTRQQRMRYLVEFTMTSDIYYPDTFLSRTEEESIKQEEQEQEISLKDVLNITDPLTKVKSGLVSKGDAPVNLKAVHVRAKLVDLASEVIVLQEYENTSKFQLEAKYVFPLGDMSAVCGFEAFINGKHIVGEVKEKETAHKEYKKAISEGHGAYLMDQDEETPDVFTVSVGNLPPGACVLIKITYVAELQVEGELISFRLPGSVAPWQKDSLKDVTQHETESHEVQQGETSVQIAVDMPFDIRSLECVTHKTRVKQTLTKATVELLPGQSIADGFQLLVGLAEIHVPRMWVERKAGDQDHQACMLTFYPQFEACEADDVNVILLLDLSHSMKGDNLVSAKKVVLLTLQHLPSSWNFNIVVFGTAFKELFPTCVKKTSSNVKLASDFVLGLSAGMGNTEAIRPMHTFYLLKSESSVQNIFLVSDGHINNEEAMLLAAHKNSQHTRVFTMAVSSTANRHALRALARVGAGAYEYFDSKVKSKWEGKVRSHINKAAQPGLTSVSVDWEQHGADVAPPVQAPKQITALFSGSRQVIYGYVPNCTMATLRATIAGEEVSTLVSTSDLSITHGMILHRLTARAMISDWEDGFLSPDKTDHEILKMNTKDFIIELSKQYSIVTQFTSFVAIEKRDKDEEKKAVDAPSMSELIEKESVDQLSYMGFEEEDKEPEEDLEKTIDGILTSIRLNSYSVEKQRDFIKEGLDKAELIDDEDIRKEKILELEEAFDDWDLEEDNLIPKRLEEAFDDWDLEEDFDFTVEFARKRRSKPKKKRMTVTVNDMTGQRMRVQVNGENTVLELKAAVYKETGQRPQDMRLIYGGRAMEDWKRLEQVDVQHGAEMHVVTIQRGGGSGPPPDTDKSVCLSRALSARRSRASRALTPSSGQESLEDSDSSDEWGSDFSEDGSGDSASSYASSSAEGEGEGESDGMDDSSGEEEEEIEEEDDDSSGEEEEEMEEEGGKGKRRIVDEEDEDSSGEEEEEEEEMLAEDSSSEEDTDFCMVEEKEAPKTRRKVTAARKSTGGKAPRAPVPTTSPGREASRAPKSVFMEDLQSKLTARRAALKPTPPRAPVPTTSPGREASKAPQAEFMGDLLSKLTARRAALKSAPPRERQPSPELVRDPQYQELMDVLGSSNLGSMKIRSRKTASTDRPSAGGKLSERIPFMGKAGDRLFTDSRMDVPEMSPRLQASAAPKAKTLVGMMPRRLRVTKEMEAGDRRFTDSRMDMPTKSPRFRASAAPRAKSSVEFAMDSSPGYNLVQSFSMELDAPIQKQSVMLEEREEPMLQLMHEEPVRLVLREESIQVMHEEPVRHVLQEQSMQVLSDEPMMVMCMQDELEPFQNFEDLSMLVQEQGGFIDNIEENVESSYLHVQQGSVELAKAVSYQASRKDEWVYPKLDDAIPMMHSNIEAVLERGEKMDALVSKAESLSSAASQFCKKSSIALPRFSTEQIDLTWEDKQLMTSNILDELMGEAEICDAISRPVGIDTDSNEEELMAELEALEQGELDEQLLDESSVGDSLPSIPSSEPVAFKRASLEKSTMLKKKKMLSAESAQAPLFRFSTSRAFDEPAPPPPPPPPCPHAPPGVPPPAPLPHDEGYIGFSFGASSNVDRRSALKSSISSVAPPQISGGSTLYTSITFGAPPPPPPPGGSTHKSSMSFGAPPPPPGRSAFKPCGAPAPASGGSILPSSISFGAPPPLAPQGRFSRGSSQQFAAQPPHSGLFASMAKPGKHGKQAVAPVAATGLMMEKALMMEERKALRKEEEKRPVKKSMSRPSPARKVTKEYAAGAEFFMSTEEKPDDSGPVRREDELYTYGIGIKIPCVETGPSKISGHSIAVFVKKLAEDAAWDLSKDMQKEMGIDFDICEQMLKKAGLPSLGVRVREELYPLLKTWIIIVFLIKTVIPASLPADFRNELVMGDLMEQLINGLHKLGLVYADIGDIFARRLVVCTPIQERYQHVCGTLELGTEWCEVFAKMYGVYSREAKRDTGRTQRKSAMGKDLLKITLMPQQIPTA